MKPEPSGEVNLGLGLLEGSSRHENEPGIVGRANTTMTLCDIGRDRYGSASYLKAQSVVFLARKCCGGSINIHRKVHGHVPGIQIFELEERHVMNIIFGRPYQDTESTQSAAISRRLPPAACRLPPACRLSLAVSHSIDIAVPNLPS